MRISKYEGKKMQNEALFVYFLTWSAVFLLIVANF